MLQDELFLLPEKKKWDVLIDLKIFLGTKEVGGGAECPSKSGKYWTILALKKKQIWFEAVW